MRNDKQFGLSEPSAAMRQMGEGESELVRAIINEGAEAYRNVIPADCWHDPYMSKAGLSDELKAGVTFIGYEAGGEVVGVMGLQTVRGIDLIRHAYVQQKAQRHGIGGSLIVRLLASTEKPVLVGTWAAAAWAIAFYERHQFSIVRGAACNILLEGFWTIPARQAQASVVLSGPLGKKRNDPTRTAS